MQKKISSLFLLLLLFSSISLRAAEKSSDPGRPASPYSLDQPFSISLKTAKLIYTQLSSNQEIGPFLDPKSIKERVSSLSERASKNQNKEEYTLAIQNLLNINEVSFSFPKDQVVVWRVFFDGKKILGMTEVIEKYSTKEKKLVGRNLRNLFKRALGFQRYTFFCNSEYLTKQRIEQRIELWIYTPKNLRIYNRNPQINTCNKKTQTASKTKTHPKKRPFKKVNRSTSTPETEKKTRKIDEPMRDRPLNLIDQEAVQDLLNLSKM